MQSTVKFMVSLLVSFEVVYLLVLVSGLYLWITVPLIVLAIILLWKQDKFICIGALAALLLSLLTVWLSFTGYLG